MWLPAWVLSTTRGGTQSGRSGRLIILYVGKTLVYAETDPFTVQLWTGKQFQLQCWTDFPLRVSALSCPLMRVFRGRPAFLGDVNEFCVHECTLYRCNNLEIIDLEQSASLAMAAIGLHLVNLMSEGSSHFRTAHHLAESVRTGTLGC